jgi:hypothetical protein
VELYVESLRLEKARRLTTTFDGVIYSFASLAREGTVRAQTASVTKPQNLASLDANNLGRVITFSKRVMRPVAWRGDTLALELGLFSVKTGNLLSPLINYVTKISDKVGSTSLTKLDPFFPLITEGLDMIAGQTTDTAIELAVDADLSLNQSRLCALVAKPKGQINETQVTIDKTDRKLLLDGAPLNAAFCVFSIRVNDRNADWGSIPALEQAYSEFTNAIVSNKRKEAQEALAGFNRQLVISPDLIAADKDRLKKKAEADLKAAFPGGGQSSTKTSLARFENRVLSDLNLYDDPVPLNRP